MWKFHQNFTNFQQKSQNFKKIFWIFYPQKFLALEAWKFKKLRKNSLKKSSEKFRNFQKVYLEAWNFELPKNYFFRIKIVKNSRNFQKIEIYVLSDSKKFHSIFKNVRHPKITKNSRNFTNFKNFPKKFFSKKF